MTTGCIWSDKEDQGLSYHYHLYFYIHIQVDETMIYQ